MARRPQKRAAADGLPSKDDILTFIQASPEKVGKREIARAFGVKGGDRIGLKRLLAEMTDDGTLAGGRKEFRERGALPPVVVLEIVERDPEGELVARPAVWDRSEGERPRVLVLAKAQRRRRNGEAPLGIGDRILANVTRLDQPDTFGCLYEAEAIKRLPKEKRAQLGIFRRLPGGGGVIDPVDRRELKEWPVRDGDDAGAETGDLVRFDLARAGRFGVPQAHVTERLGNPQDQRQISLIAVHAHGIPDAFPDAVLAELGRLPALETRGREDLTGLPLVTIDPRDARDHDDAVAAEPDPDPHNKGGWIVWVAIADVAYYVRPGTRLDREAQLRGNSVYFPDRVVPMLPELISNDLCSLREGEERPALAVRMIFDRHGRKRAHTFVRAIMRSPAKLSYEEAQAAIDGRPSAKCRPLMRDVLQPLWAAWRALAEGRARREPLDLDLPERKILLDEHGRVARVVVPERLDAHRLIEEFMIQANVAAAEILQERRAPVIYRVHAEPSKEKLTALREFLETVDIRLPGAGNLKAANFNRVLERAKDLPVRELINEVVLRSQAQAEYTTENYGHFGLNLQRYAHFTSPIRRYADLIVHRSLIRACKLGAGALSREEEPLLAEVATAISQAERRAMAAERETADRLVASFLADRVGAEFKGRISGVTRSGLFVRLAETGADGFIPVATLLGDFYRHDEDAHALVGQRSGETFRLGDSVSVRLVEAIPTAGALRFEMLSAGGRDQGARLRKGLRRGRRGAPRAARWR